MKYAAIGEGKNGKIKYVVLWHSRASAQIFVKYHAKVMQPKLRWRIAKAGRAPDIWPFLTRQGAV